MDKANNKEYSVIYYDVKNVTPERLCELHEQLVEFHKNRKINYILLPSDVKQKWMNKEELLRQLKIMITEVESWE